MKQVTIQIYGITGSGCGMYASITLPEDYTMRQLVNACKARGFIQFRTPSMNQLASI